MNVRDNRFDILKGILIILVVLGHALQYGFGSSWMDSGAFMEDKLFQGIYSFHMPLFMLISGYFFRHTNIRPFGKVLWSKCVSLLIPWAVFFILLSSATIAGVFKSAGFVEGISKTVHLALNFMWFLPALFFNVLVVGVMTRILTNKTLQCIVLAFMAIAMLFLPRGVVPSTYIFVFPFFVLGYYANSYWEKITSLLSQLPVFLCLTVLFAVSVVLYRSEWLVYSTGVALVNGGFFSLSQAGVDMIRFVVGIIGCAWLESAVYLFAGNNGKGILSCLGRETMGIYGIQTVCFVLIQKVFTASGVEITYNFITPFLLASAVLFVSHLSVILLSKTKVTALLFLGDRNLIKK